MQITTLHCHLNELSAGASDWLTEPSSLSKRLRDITQNTIKALTHFAGWGYALAEESELLGLETTETVWVRELDWMMAKQPWVCARTIIPAKTMELIGNDIKNLRDQTTLGDVIFRRPDLQRQSIQITQLKPGNKLYQRATRVSSNFIPPLWTRRSVFTIADMPLLVTEAFHPAALRYQP